jgi:hypothetical protein
VWKKVLPSTQSSLATLTVAIKTNTVHNMLWRIFLPHVTARLGHYQGANAEYKAETIEYYIKHFRLKSPDELQRITVHQWNFKTAIKLPSTPSLL